MGFFGGKTITVSSTVYNLAGDEDHRPDFLKTAVIGSILSSSKDSMTDKIHAAYWTGPGLKLRNFAHWSNVHGYTDLIGQVAGEIALPKHINTTLLASQITPLPGYVVSIQTAKVGQAAYTYWVDQYMLEHHPSLINTNYVSDFNEALNLITITLEGGAVETFTPTDFMAGGWYLYSLYTMVAEGSDGPVTTGETVLVDETHPFPDIDEWTYTSTSSDPPHTERWEKSTYLGWDSTHTKLQTKVEIMWFDTTTGSQSYRIDTQINSGKSYGPGKMLIYPRNTGNAVFDSFFSTTSGAGGFFPFIPMRVNNWFIAHDYIPDVYFGAKKAFKKAVGGDYDKIIAQIAANPNLEQLNYAHTVFGVSLNVKENACRKYIYNFFELIMAGQDLSDSAYQAWKDAYAVAHEANQAWADWSAAQSDEANPLFGTPEPATTSYPPTPSTSLTVASTRAQLGYNVTISWAAVRETTGSGLQNPGAKVGQLWFDLGSTETFDQLVTTGGHTTLFSDALSMGGIHLYWQVDATHWKCLTITNLSHTNMVYGGKAVTTYAAQALSDPKESGFIIPLHQGIFHATNLVSSTQMSTACCFIVFNTYTTTKTSFWSSMAFKVLLIVVVLVVTVVTGGLGGGLGIGLLGTDAAVGASLGLTGTAALVAGAVANALAAMVVGQIIMYGSKAVFGDDIGAIIGTIASIIAVNVGSSLMSGASLTTSFGDMLSASNLLKLTEAIGNGYTAMINASTRDTLGKLSSLQTAYNTEMDEIHDKTEQIFGDNQSIINPSMVTDVLQSNHLESPSTWLTRTLMTGTDIATLSMDMLTNFADITTQTELPI